MISAVSNPGIFTPNRLIAALGASRVASIRSATYGSEEEEADRTTSVQDAEEVRTDDAGPVGKSELTEEEQAQIEELAKRDEKVRRHEQAHKAAAGQYARGGPHFEYQVGPDGKSYAVGGEVKIDTSPVPDDPEATIRKMQQIRAAATAPADPSSQDRQVVAEAASNAQQAKAEIAKDGMNPQPQGEASGTSSPGSGQGGASGSASFLSGSTLSSPAAGLMSILGQQAMLASGRFIDVRV